MPNQRLRNALVGAGLTQATLAERVEVDAKSVERWITQDRTPHATTRARIARVLGHEETYFWPQLLGTTESRNATQAELVQIWPTRHSVPGEVWRSLLSQSGTRVDVLVYAGSFLFEAYDFIEVIRTQSAAGTNYRILLGDGRSEAVRTRAVEERRPAIAARCASSVEYISEVTGLPGVSVRTHGTTLYVSIFRFDDSMLINSHTFGSIPAQSPVMHLQRVPGGQLFDFYDQAFERVWATGEPVA